MSEHDVLNAEFARRFPDAFARTLGGGKAEEIRRILAALPSPVAASIAARLPAPRVASLLESGEYAQWLADASFDDAKALLGRMPREISLAAVNSLSDPKLRRRLQQHLKYPAHSVGALVRDVPVRIADTALASDVITELRSLDIEEPDMLVVLQTNGRYVGTVRFWDLLSSKTPAGPVREFVTRTPAILPETSLVSASQSEAWDANLALPVVDHEQHLLGTVSRKRVLAAARNFTAPQHRATDVVASLVADLYHMLGDLLEQFAGRQGRT